MKTQINQFQYIILLILTQYCYSQWREVDSGRVDYPAYTYSIAHATDDQVQGIIRWDDSSSNLDLLVYTNDLPIFDDLSAMMRFQVVNGLAVEAFSFGYIPTTGRISLRINPLLISRTFVNYSIEINTTNSRTHASNSLLCNGVIYKDYKFMNFVRIPNLLTNMVMTIQYQINSADYIRLRLPIFPQYEDIEPLTPVDLPAQSSPTYRWTAVFNHAIDNSYTTVQSFTFRIVYQSAALPASFPQELYQGVGGKKPSLSALSQGF